MKHKNIKITALGLALAASLTLTGCSSHRTDVQPTQSGFVVNDPNYNYGNNGYYYPSNTVAPTVVPTTAPTTNPQDEMNNLSSSGYYSNGKDFYSISVKDGFIKFYTELNREDGKHQYTYSYYSNDMVKAYEMYINIRYGYVPFNSDAYKPYLLEAQHTHINGTLVETEVTKRNNDGTFSTVTTSNATPAPTTPSEPVIQTPQPTVAPTTQPTVPPTTQPTVPPTTEPTTQPTTAPTQPTTAPTQPTTQPTTPGSSYTSVEGNVTRVITYTENGYIEVRTVDLGNGNKNVFRDEYQIFRDNGKVTFQLCSSYLNGEYIGRTQMAYNDIEGGLTTETLLVFDENDTLLQKWVVYKNESGVLYKVVSDLNQYGEEVGSTTYYGDYASNVTQADLHVKTR